MAALGALGISRAALSPAPADSLAYTFRFLYHLKKQYFAQPGFSSGFLRIRGHTQDASTDFPDVDGGDLRHRPEAQTARAVPRRSDARAADALQPGLCRMRQDPISRP